MTARVYTPTRSWRDSRGRALRAMRRGPVVLRSQRLRAHTHPPPESPIPLSPALHNIRAVVRAPDPRELPACTGQLPVRRHLCTRTICYSSRSHARRHAVIHPYGDSSKKLAGKRVAPGLHVALTYLAKSSPSV